MVLILLMAWQFTYAQKYKIKEKKGKSALFYDGDNITGYVYDDIKRNISGKRKVKAESGWGLIRQTGELLIPCQYDTLISIGKERYIVAAEGKYGVVSEVDEEVLEKKYDKIDHYTDEECLAKLDGQWTLIKGEEVSTDWQSFVFVRPDQPALYGSCSPSEIKKGKKDKACSQLKMLEFVYGNIRYPALARKSGVEGTCVIRFIIDKSGDLRDFEITRDIGAGCGEEALRIIKKMGKWTPAQENGINVSMVFNFPIKFKLQ